MFGETMLLPAIPDIIRDFKISYNTSSWILTAYLISAAVMTPIGGKLSDMYGRKKIVIIIMVVYIIGITLGGFANSIYFLIATRIIQGMGVAMFPVAFSIIRDKFPPEKLAIAVGIFSAMYAGGSVGGFICRRQYNQQFWMACYIFLYSACCNCTLVHNQTSYS